MAPHLRGLWTEGLSGWPRPHAPCFSGSLLLGTGPSARLESPLRPGISLSKYPRGALCCACFPISAVSCQVCSRAPGLAGYRVTGVFVWGCFDEAISTKGGRTNSEKRNAKLKKKRTFSLSHFQMCPLDNEPQTHKVHLNVPSFIYNPRIVIVCLSVCLSVLVGPRGQEAKTAAPKSTSSPLPALDACTDMYVQMCLASIYGLLTPRPGRPPANTLGPERV